MSLHGSQLCPAMPQPSLTCHSSQVLGSKRCWRCSAPATRNQKCWFFVAGPTKCLIWNRARGRSSLLSAFLKKTHKIKTSWFLQALATVPLSNLSNIWLRRFHVIFWHHAIHTLCITKPTGSVISSKRVGVWSAMACSRSGYLKYVCRSIPYYLAISWLVNIIIIISTRDWARLVQLRQAEQSQKPARIFSPNVWLEDVLDCSLCLDAEARCKWGSGRTFVVATLPFLRQGQSENQTEETPQERHPNTTLATVMPNHSQQDQQAREGATKSCSGWQWSTQLQPKLGCGTYGWCLILALQIEGLHTILKGQNRTVSSAKQELEF